MIRILIDSGIDQNTFMRESYDYGFLPLSIILDNTSYLDQKEIQLKEVHDFMKKGNVPKTSQVSPETVLKALDNSRAKGEDVIYIALTSKVSGTINVAEAIVNEYLLSYPEMNIAVIDSEGGAGGGALLALQALEMVKQGMDYESIVSIT